MSTEKRTVLIVDDDAQVREVLHQIFLSADYQCLLAGDGREAVGIFTATRPPLTITDLRMPVMDGIGLLRGVRQIDADAAVVVLTGAPDVKTAIDALRLGAYDFIVKPVNVDELLIAAERAIERRQLLIERREYQQMLERRVDEATRDLQVAYERVRQAHQATLETLGAALDSRDVGTESHSRRVHGYALATARAHGVPESDDGGPRARRPAPRHRQDRDPRRDPPQARSADARGVADHAPPSGDRPAAHRERAVPAGGHPDRLLPPRAVGRQAGIRRGCAREDIPLGARIFAVVDAFDAMTADRPYSKAIPFADARAEIARSAGSHFDPAVVDSFLTVPDAVLAEIRRKSTEQR